MFIFTADDYGKTRHATDNILGCFANSRITSTSAMVFMEDSDRAASLALKTSVEVGLHLNFTEPFNASNTSSELCEHQKKIISYLAKNKFAEVIYNPFLADSFNFLFRAQHEEFRRLYGKLPDFINGHHHMHLCANVLVRNLISKKTRVRRTFTFGPGEKGFLNLMYRHILDFWISRRFISTDHFFSIVPFQNHQRLMQIVSLAEKENVELEVHPENAEENDFLLSEQWRRLFEFVECGCFQHLSN